MFFRHLALAMIIATPALATPGHITSLTIHSDENRAYCNDGFRWDTTEGMCMPDNGR